LEKTLRVVVERVVGAGVKAVVGARSTPRAKEGSFMVAKLC
jgi:hypothetical protein